MKKKRKKEKVSKKKKEKRKALWITVVIHSVLCVGEQ
jgi:nitrate reductase NapE component